MNQPTQDRVHLLLLPGQLDRLLQRRAEVIGSPGLSAQALSDAWRDAAAVWEALGRAEAGVADEACILPLPDTCQPHIDRLSALTGVQRSFEIVPVSFGLVPLAQLVVSQHYLTESSLQALAPAGAPLPSLEEQLALCLPTGPQGPQPALRTVYTSADEMVLACDSHDVRWLGTRCMAGSDLGAIDVPGHVDMLVGAALGYSSNLVNVILHGGRVVLHNGHHRVQALRRLGATHVPCLIQVCARADEVMAVASGSVRDHFDLLFEAPRPPLAHDFDHAGLTCSLQTPRMRHELRVRVQVERRKVAW